MYFHLTASMDVNRLRIFINLKDNNAKCILVFVKKKNLQTIFYYIYFKIIISGRFKIKIFY